MPTIAHISDLHFGRVDPAVTEAMKRKLAALHPTLIAVSGDLTQNATEAEFAAAGAFLRNMPARTLVVPGNHDLTLRNPLHRFLRPYAHYTRHISGERNPLYYDDHVAVAGLDTTRRTLPINGAYGDAQLAAAARFFDWAGPSRLKIVVAHHPLVNSPNFLFERRAWRADRAIRSFSASGVDLVLGGHYHNSFILEARADQGTARRGVLMACISTATSTRLLRCPNAFYLIRFERDREHPRMSVQEYAWERPEFVASRQSVFERVAGRWYPLDNPLADGFHSLPPRPGFAGPVAPQPI